MKAQYGFSVVVIILNIKHVEGNHILTELQPEIYFIL